MLPVGSRTKFEAFYLPRKILLLLTIYLPRMQNTFSIDHYKPEGNKSITCYQLSVLALRKSASVLDFNNSCELG